MGKLKEIANQYNGAFNLPRKGDEEFFLRVKEVDNGFLVEVEDPVHGAHSAVFSGRNEVVAWVNQLFDELI